MTGATRQRGTRKDSVRNRARLLAAARELVDRARRAGAVRADAAPQDIAVIFGLLGPTFDMSRSTSPGLWRRYLALILDGLRATDRPDLPTPAPSIDALPAILKMGKRR